MAGKKKRAESGGWMQHIMFVHWRVKLNPSDSHHHVFPMFIYIKCSLNVHFSQLIMTLHNTFHAWIPCENRSSWIYCIVFFYKMAWHSVSWGINLASFSSSPYTNGFWIGFLFIQRRWGILCGFTCHRLLVNKEKMHSYTAHNNALKVR